MDTSLTQEITGIVFDFVTNMYALLSFLICYFIGIGLLFLTNKIKGSKWHAFVYRLSFKFLMYGQAGIILYLGASPSLLCKVIACFNISDGLQHT